MKKSLLFVGLFLILSLSVFVSAEFNPNTANDCDAVSDCVVLYTEEGAVVSTNKLVEEDYKIWYSELMGAVFVSENPLENTYVPTCANNQCGALLQEEEIEENVKCVFEWIRG